jgi:hypothetical protein
VSPALAPYPKFGNKSCYYGLNEAQMHGAEEVSNDLTPMPNFPELSHGDKKVKGGQGGRKAGC